NPHLSPGRRTRGRLAGVGDLQGEVRPDGEDVAPSQAIDNVPRERVLPGRQDRPVAIGPGIEASGPDRDGRRPGEDERPAARGGEVARPGRVTVRVPEEPVPLVLEKADEHPPLGAAVTARDPQLDDVAEAMAPPPRPDERIQ